ncbi:hypothetical protein [Calothrix sp. 336/3]|uniref:hypothetical protein n=1 Tax=Calothrix sp. 336/3 TaxID=1337936 RepID=UPI0004E41857|nr:hypothetical protein [Calothrix sp. 336/3]AKG22147.1 hypothetical protein IJ00_13530 [Calothrix sp. 336/3]
MNNKFLGILAASAAVVGGVFAAAPAQALDVELPVEVKVEPFMYLRTYNSLKFTVTPGDLNATFKDATPPDYVEGQVNTLDPTAPTAQNIGAATTVEKTVNPLYRLWGPSGVTADVNVTVVNDQLTHKNLANAATNNSATMSVKAGTGVQTGVALSPTGSGRTGSVTLVFDFGAGGAQAGTYSQGSIKITATNP